MEISSHYYALLALCKTIGLDDKISYTLAYSSQYVDDAKINHLVSNDKIVLSNIATAHRYFKINTYTFSAMIYNTCAFHFLPACKGDSFTQKLICQKDSKIINTILTNNLKSSPQKFGMLLHIYADTFAHQGFSGLLSKPNQICDLKNTNGTFILKVKYFFNKSFDTIIKDFVPAYGHGQAYHYPDIPYLKWSYKYDNETSKTANIFVDNQERYKEAFDKIHNYLLKYIKINNITTDIKNYNLDQFYNILAIKANDDKKIKLWQDYLTTHKYFEPNARELKYDETVWLKECFDDFKYDKYNNRVVKDAIFKPDYKSSSWFQFVKAVKEYKIELKQILKNNNLELPN
jgi:hypothetical protein